MLSALGMGCPKSTSTGLEGLFNFHIQEAEFKNTNKKTYKIKKCLPIFFLLIFSTSSSVLDHMGENDK